MNGEEIKIIITSETDKAASNLLKANEALDKFTAACEKATGALEKFGTGLDKTEKSGKRLGSTMPKLGNSVVNANGALVSLNRIVQDAPFGFIAIGNNITELVERINTMNQATGSTGKSLKAMAGSFLGAGGVMFAISGTVSLLTVLVQKYGSLSNAIGVLNPFLSAHTRLINELNAAWIKNSQAAAEEAAKVDLLVMSVKDLNVPLEDRRRITDELIKQYPNTFEGLTAEAIAAGEADSAYKELTKTLLAQAAVKAGTELIGERGQKLLQLRIEAAKLDAELKDLRDTSNDSFFGSFADRSKQIAAVQNNININKAKQNKLEKETAIIQQEQLKLVEQFGAKLLGIKGPTNATQVFNQLNIDLAKIDERARLTGENAKKVAQLKLPLLTKAFEEIANIGGEKAQPILKQIGDQINSLQAVTGAKNVKTVSDVLKALQADLDATDAQAKLFGGTADNLANEKLKALSKAFDALIEIGLKPTAPEIKNIADQINLLSASIIGIKPLTTILAQPLGKAVKTTTVKPLTPDELKKLLGITSESQLLLEPKVRVEPIFQETPSLQNLDQFTQQFNAKMDKLQQETKRKFEKEFINWNDALNSGVAPAIIDLTNNLQQGLASAFSTLGESLGKAFAGSGLGDVLKGIVTTMGDFLITFGRQMVEAGTLVLIAQKSLIANPLLAIAAGTAAIAIGSLLKNKVPAFAQGGITNGPTLALVGDNPGGREAIVPSQDWREAFGGQRQEGGYIAEARFSRGDLLLLIKQALREEGRL